MRPTTKKLLALSAAASLGLAACGEDEVVTPAVSGEPVVVAPTTTMSAPPAAPDASVDDPASTLRAALTSLLREHVYLAGLGLETALDVGADDPATQAALDALDENTVALGDAVATVPGVESPDDFVELWRDHIGYFVDYTVGRAEDDQEAMDQALSDLAGYQEDAAAFFEEITEGELLADDVFAELETHVTMVTGLVDALAGAGEEDADPFELLRDAADHMDGVALSLADGVVSAHEDAIAGDPNSVPAETRAELTAGLQEQVYLAVVAAEQLAESGSTDDDAYTAAVSLLQGAPDDLANTVGAATGTAEREAFLDAWRPHLEALTSYAEARITGDDATAETARAELDAAGDQVAAVLSELAGGADVSALIDRHVETVAAAIDALAAGESTAFVRARQAAQVMPELAAALAAGIVQASELEDAAAGQGAEGGADLGDGTGVAPDEAGQGTTSGGSVDGPAPGGGADLTGPGVEESEEPPSDPSEAGGPSAEGDR